MKSWRLVVWFGLALLLSGCSQRSDKDLLSELHKLSAAPDLKEEKIKTEAEFRELWKKRATTAKALLKDFESSHAKSPLLNDARAETLKILRRNPSDSDAALELAKTLLADAPQGSDLAAQADLYLALREIQTKFKDSTRTPEELRDVWYKNAEALRQRFEGLLTTYPKNRHIADAAEEVLQMAEQVDDPKTRRMILEHVSKNQPDHPIAFIAHREKSLGKEIVFEFTPVGSEKKMSLKDLRGKVVVVDFWATWCGPCKAEIPKLKELYEKYRAKGLEILGVSRDNQLAELTAYVQGKGLSWPQVFGPEADAFADEWGINAIPAVFVLDRQGRLHSLNARGKLEKLVPELLGVK